MGADHAPHPPAGVNTAEAFLEHGREVLANQPFSVLLGAELTALSAGRCELSLALTPQLRQQHGFAHGVVSYMADNTLTYAGGAGVAPRAHPGRMLPRGVRGAGWRGKALRRGAGNDCSAAADRAELRAGLRSFQHPRKAAVPHLSVQGEAAAVPAGATPCGAL